MGLTERNFGEDREARMYEQVRAVAMGHTRESWGLGDVGAAPVVVKIAQITGEKNQRAGSRRLRRAQSRRPARRVAPALTRDGHAMPLSQRSGRRLLRAGRSTLPL